MVIDAEINILLERDADFLYGILRSDEPWEEFSGLVKTDEEFRQIVTEMGIVRHKLAQAKKDIMQKGRTANGPINTQPPRITEGTIA